MVYNFVKLEVFARLRFIRLLALCHADHAFFRNNPEHCLTVTKFDLLLNKRPHANGNADVGGHD
jgi:hypothetical protein